MSEPITYILEKECFDGIQQPLLKRIKELEEAIKKHKKQRDTDWLELKVATDGDNKLWAVLEDKS